MEISTSINNKELVKTRREQIVHSAIKLFVKKGFHKTTLEDLAKDLGVSHGSIYKYVSSKEDILHLIHEYLAEKIEEYRENAFGEIKDKTNPLEKLRQVIEKRFDLVSDFSDAVLVMYRESHILSKDFLKMVLNKEREYLSEIEDILEEGNAQKKLKDCNPRIVSNLISIMVDAWALKAWDLRKNTSRQEMESIVTDLVIDGLSKKESHFKQKESNKRLKGKKVLVVNSSSMFGAEIASFLISNQSEVSFYDDDLHRNKDDIIFRDVASGSSCYSALDHGPLTEGVLEKIIESDGPFDYLVYCLPSSFNYNGGINDDYTAKEKCRSQIFNAIDIEPLLLNEAREKKAFGRIVYVGPCAWDIFVDSIHHELSKDTAAALTKRQSNLLAPFRISVNCIMPGFIIGGRSFSLNEKLVRKALDIIPMGYIGKIDEILNTLSFLLEDEMKYITGQIITVGGGL